jgi:arginyl-tRNA synthetase
VNGVVEIKKLNMSLQKIIGQKLVEGVSLLYNTQIEEKQIQLQKTKKEFEGDITLVVFPLLRISKKTPEQTAEELGVFLQEKLDIIQKFNIVKGFLNLSVSDIYYINFLKTEAEAEDFGQRAIEADADLYMVEYSSPNTNKPLHLGHIRNNLLGWSICCILEANGKRVVKTNIVNDRGIHICKSMLAWQKWGKGETPEKSGKKGDHLVGDYYVKFDQEYKKQIADRVALGATPEEAAKNAPLILEAQEMLIKWEAHDPEIHALWKTMNAWVYEGFSDTYQRLGVAFDKIYYESDTYSVGRTSVISGLDQGVFYQRPDNSVWINLTDDGLDEKLVLRSDGTSVYITQDIGTAQLRQQDYAFDKMIYVVGNEQNYHFKVLALILDKLGFSWAKSLHHLSYGMVELPEGKMKSREGTVVDADDLMDEMVSNAREMADELGKLEGLNKEEKNKIYEMIGMGALKYFILKVDPTKNMTFNPKESIDFNGNTGPFIQYTYARIQSVIRKAGEMGLVINKNYSSQPGTSEKEKSILKLIYDYPTVVTEAAESYSPAIIANYIYDLAKEYNQFYHDFVILKEEDDSLRNFRMHLSEITGKVIKRAMLLLGIEVPERM